MVCPKVKVEVMPETESLGEFWTSAPLGEHSPSDEDHMECRRLEFTWIMKDRTRTRGQPPECKLRARLQHEQCNTVEYVDDMYTE